MTCLALVDGVCQTYCIRVVCLPPVRVFLLMNTAETWQHFRFSIFWLHMFLICPEVYITCVAIWNFCYPKATSTEKISRSKQDTNREPTFKDIFSVADPGFLRRQSPTPLLPLPRWNVDCRQSRGWHSTEIPSFYAKVFAENCMKWKNS